MPSKTLPDGFPDPEALLRDKNWEQNYPKLILRGIYDVMERDRKAGKGSLKECYTKAFNVVVFGLAKKSEPPRITVSNGTFSLTGEGYKREAEVIGEREIPKERRKTLGVYKSRREMQVDTALKMKKLRIWIDMLSNELSDQMPNKSPTIQASS